MFKTAERIHRWTNNLAGFTVYTEEEKLFQIKHAKCLAC